MTVLETVTAWGFKAGMVGCLDAGNECCNIAGLHDQMVDVALHALMPELF